MVIFLCCLHDFVVAAESPLPELQSDTELATAGYYRIEWQLSGVSLENGLRYELQESMNSGFQDFVILYQGPDQATVLSGRENGVRFYRLRAFQVQQLPSQWSNTLRVETNHHSLERALLFFTMGALVFVLTLLLIFFGHRAQRRTGPHI